MIRLSTYHDEIVVCWVSSNSGLWCAEYETAGSEATKWWGVPDCTFRGEYLPLAGFN